MIFFKNFISYILVTNSQIFPLLLNMFINVFFTNKTLWWIKIFEYTTIFYFSLYKKYFTISIQNMWYNFSPIRCWCTVTKRLCYNVIDQFWLNQTWSQAHKRIVIILNLFTKTALLKGVELFYVILLYNQLSQIKNANGVGYKAKIIIYLRTIFWWLVPWLSNLGKECV